MSAKLFVSNIRRSVKSIKSLRYIVPNVLNSIKNKSYSHLIFVSDGVNWVLDWEVKEIKSIAEGLGFSTKITQPSGLFKQSIFYSNKYFLRKPENFLKRKNHIAFPYFHGYPSSGEASAVLCYENLKKFHHYISRIQISHTYMRDIILETGIDPQKVFLIPIGINPDFFQIQTPESKKEAREKYGVSQEAIVVGSFQKDGEGWGEGLTPKLIKGPDVFVEAVSILKSSVPELFVLLSGPARGYVKRGLERLNIPYKHIYLQDYPEVGQLFQCLDLYIVAAREEGGPKAILESMASGIPLVTTRVGQAMDLVKHGENGMMVDVNDAEGLASGAMDFLSDSEMRKKVIKSGFETVKENTYLSQTPLWEQFFKGFVVF